MDGRFGAPLPRQPPHSPVHVLAEAQQVADYPAVQQGAVGVGVGQVGGLQVEAAELVEDALADARCPVAQSEEYFVALKRLGKTVKFVRFPNSNHAIPRTGHPKMREEYLARMLGWFDDWLG